MGARRHILGAVMREMIGMAAVRTVDVATGERRAPVGHGFNEEGLILCHSPPPGLLGGIVHSKHVIAVHSD